MRYRITSEQSADSLQVFGKCRSCCVLVKRTAVMRIQNYVEAVDQWMQSMDAIA